jgi:hypothetical protein
MSVEHARYADPVQPLDDSPGLADSQPADGERDPLAVPENVLAARQRSMSERLELALSWNALAAELRAGLAAVIQRPDTSR